jgi:hypothetical protein
MNFYLGVWNSPTVISDDEAAARYLALSDEKSVEPEFDASVYNFYCGLVSLFPEVETVPEDELDSCPWACGIDIAADHVIMAIQIAQAQKIIGQIVSLAAKYELICFDPQAGKVYLPPRFETKRTPGAAAPTCASASQPSPIQLGGEPQTGGAEGL